MSKQTNRRSFIKTTISATAMAGIGLVPLISTASLKSRLPGAKKSGGEG